MKVRRNISATVADVKMSIQIEHTQRPLIKHQKLLYKGKELSDSVKLSDLVSEDTEPKFYLTISQPEQPAV